MMKVPECLVMLAQVATMGSDDGTAPSVAIQVAGTKQITCTEMEGNAVAKIQTLRDGRVIDPFTVVVTKAELSTMQQRNIDVVNAISQIKRANGLMPLAQTPQTVDLELHRWFVISGVSGVLAQSPFWDYLGSNAAAKGDDRLKAEQLSRPNESIVLHTWRKKQTAPTISQIKDSVAMFLLEMGVGVVKRNSCEPCNSQGQPLDWDTLIHTCGFPTERAALGKALGEVHVDEGMFDGIVSRIQHMLKVVLLVGPIKSFDETFRQAGVALVNQQKVTPEMRALIDLANESIGDTPPAIPQTTPTPSFDIFAAM